MKAGSQTNQKTQKGAEIHHRRVSGSVPESVPENGSVRRSVPRNVPAALGPRAPECPKNVPRVSPECQKGVSDTLGTLFRDTRAPRARETPVAGRQDRNSHRPAERSISTSPTKNYGTEKNRFWEVVQSCNASHDQKRFPDFPLNVMYFGQN